MTDEYAGIVYDLDGTLVRLAVDWDAAAEDVRAVYERAGVDTGSGDLWTMLGRAADHGVGDEVEAAIAAHEREGARESRRLPLSDDLAGHERPMAVCSLNCEEACRIALETHDLAADVDGVIGRDSVARHKPHPEPLLAAVETLGVAPEQAVFVGDSERDAETANRAGIDFRYVEGTAPDG